ncbi:MAG: diguanylate cyclase [Tumebacillaceae bacterium]
MLNVQEKAEKKQRMLLKGKKLYVQELAKQIEALEELLTLLTARFDLEDAQHVYRIAHKMKGSAPIFGFVRAGEVAGQLVTLWEWTQTPLLTEPQVDNWLELCGDYLVQLKIEYEICVKEMEMDAQDRQTVISPLMLTGRLLMIDDDDTLRDYLVEQFQRAGYDVDDASGVEQAKKMLRDQVYDVILLDLMMYPQSGYELFEFLKEDPTLKWIPLVVLSGRDDLEDKVRCLRMGADDYVTKPFQYEELEARVYSLLKRSKQFEEMAFRDALTGVYNRRYFDQQLQMELRWVQRDNSPISLTFIDIDRFKHVNDTYGHHIGDLVLQGLSHLLQQNIRGTDFLARYGGEELVILLPDTTAKQALNLMERIAELVRTQPMARHQGQEFYVTFSAGVAEWKPGMDAQKWIELADSAMYQAKQQGRDRTLISQGMSACELAGMPAVPQKVKRLLIADDDKLLREIVKSRLSSLPVELLEAEDGESVLQQLRAKPVDVLLLDGIMPKIDGFDLLAEIKRDVRFRKVKVIILSSRHQEEDVVRGLQLGADDYVSKPFSLLELEIRVKRLLGLT